MRIPLIPDSGAAAAHVRIDAGGSSNAHSYLDQTVHAREKSLDDVKIQLQQQTFRVRDDIEVKADFINEMSRFIPAHVKQRTIEHPEYWDYVKDEIVSMSNELITSIGKPTKNKFDMGL